MIKPNLKLFHAVSLSLIIFLFIKPIVFTDYFHLDDIYFYSHSAGLLTGINDGRTHFWAKLLYHRSFFSIALIKLIIFCIYLVASFCIFNFIYRRTNNFIYGLFISLLPFTAFTHVILMGFSMAFVASSFQMLLILVTLIAFNNKNRKSFALYSLAIFGTLFINQSFTIYSYLILLSLYIYPFKKTIANIKQNLLIEKLFIIHLLTFIPYLIFVKITHYYFHLNGSRFNSATFPDLGNIWDKLYLALTSLGPWSIIPSDYTYIPILLLPISILLIKFIKEKNYKKLFFTFFIFSFSTYIGLVGELYYRAWWPAQCFGLIALAYFLLFHIKKNGPLILCMVITSLICLNSIFLDGFATEKNIELNFLEQSLSSEIAKSSIDIKSTNIYIQLPYTARELSQNSLCSRIPCTGWGDFSVKLSSALVENRDEKGYVSGYATDYILYISDKYGWDINREQIKEIDPNLPPLQHENKDSITINMIDLENFLKNQPHSRYQAYKYLPLISVLLLVLFTLLSQGRYSYLKNKKRN
jgi:hypothetical protein